MTNSEKVAYLKGLMEGMGLDTDAGEGKLFSAIADILGSIASDVEDMEHDLNDLNEDVDSLSDDLGDLQDAVLDLQLDGDDEDGDYYDDEDGEDAFDHPSYRLSCPSCGYAFTVDDDVVESGHAQCPICDKLIEFDQDDVEVDGNF